MTAPAGAPFDTDRVQLLVVSCLTAIQAAAASFTPAVSLPSRQIAGAGAIPNDCEQVYATALRISTGAPEGIGPLAASTWPTTASGANQTMYSAIIQLSIVRKTSDTPTGPLGQTAPTPAAYLANLAAFSADAAVLLAAVGQIADAQMSASPRTETAGTPQGGLINTMCQLTVLV